MGVHSDYNHYAGGAARHKLRMTAWLTLSLHSIFDFRHFPLLGINGCLRSSVAQ